jgi:hypothetical protein
MRRCAGAASARGKVLSMTGLMVPSARRAIRAATKRGTIACLYIDSSRKVGVSFKWSSWLVSKVQICLSRDSFTAPILPKKFHINPASVIAASLLDSVLTARAGCRWIFAEELN